MHLLCACECVRVRVILCEPHNPEENEENFLILFDGMRYLRFDVQLFILFWFWITTFPINSNIVTRLILNDVQDFFSPEVARRWHGSFEAAE